ncbi:hypothetical protein ACFQ7W_35230, partial [Streptomyces niveus]|uniref:hypothetical protein n=1 Tax=Streptomyces niveus TaxID=193462 RepID=UPI0036898092
MGVTASELGFYDFTSRAAKRHRSDVVVRLVKGRPPDAESAIRTVATDVRESLATVLSQCQKNLAGAHQQSV